MSRIWRWLVVLLVVVVFGLTPTAWVADLLGFVDQEREGIDTFAKLAGTLIALCGAVWAFVKGGEKPRSRPGKAEAAYLKFLQGRYRFLDVRGMGINNRVPIQLPLLDLYVPLLARPELPEGETWKREAIGGLGGRVLAVEEAERLGRCLSEPRRVLELVVEHEGLVILGDPGSGKTTFLKFLALKLAAGAGGTLGLGNRLPVLVPLSAFANALAKEDLRLDDFVATYVRSLGGDADSSAMVEQALEKGRALLLLDGLDEVRDTALRHKVVSRVAAFFAFHRPAGNKFVITSRIVGYQDVRTSAEGLGECTLVDFGKEEIADFVGRWAGAFERQAQGAGQGAEQDGERERRELLAAVERNAGVRRLATNPLLLTILALMKRQGMTLPERRVELYEQYVNTLLSSWNQARSLDQQLTIPLDVKATVKILAPLARWMHQEDPGLGLVKREDLRRKLEGLFRERGAPQPEVQAQALLDDVQMGSSLVLDRGAGEFGFIHLTFEEYLAAAAFALENQGDAEAIVGTLAPYLGDPAWHEVALLVVGYVCLIQQLDQIAGQVLERLVSPLAEEFHGLEAGAATVLAGQALCDLGVAAVPRESEERVTAALVETLQNPGVGLRLRRQAGLILGRMLWLPEDLNVFVEVPAGPFLYGEGKAERQIAKPFWIARYPVTNRQFTAFVEEGGYRREELWSKEGWRWRKKEDRQGPWDRDEEWTNPIFPRVGVTFYEAEAFACWFGSQAESFEVAGRKEPMMASRLRVGLPSEEQWERAARGVDGRAYPWGEVWDPAQANTKETQGEEDQLLGTTPVCTFTGGRSPVGAWDMSGDVFEWTLPSKGEYQLAGGSFYTDEKFARCAARDGNIPADYDYLIGFRLVLSLADSDS